MTRSWTRGSSTCSSATRPAAGTPPRATPRLRGRVGVVFATSGPGATNIVTPLTDAMMDSVPLVAFTGQVRTELLGTDGFQEADTFGITMPIVKHSFVIQHPTEIPRVVHEAFHIARTGRPGPVLIDIPQDLSRAEIDYQPVQDVHLPGYQPTLDGNSKQIRLAAKALANARRPVLYAGGGVINAEASEELRELARSRQLPGHVHADGPRRLPGARTSSGSACSACTAPARPTTRWTRRTSSSPIGAPLRRPHHGQAERVRPAREVHPHRHRPGRDLQERAGAHPDRRRRKRILGRLVGEYRALEPDAARLAGWWERIEHWRAQHPLKYDDSARQRDQAAVPRRVALQGDRQRRVHPVLGRRPAPDVGGAVLPLQQAAALDQLRRPRDDGLRPAGRDRRRRSRSPDVPSRAADRRRLVPDEHPGARRPRASSTSR